MAVAISSVTIEVADAFRYMVIGSGLVIFGVSAAIVREAYRFKEPTNYVRLFFASYLALETALIIEVHTLIGHDLTWRAPLVLAANGLGVAAIVALWSHFHALRGEQHGQ